VANILCVIELLGGRALPVSLEVLGQGRRLASELGATLYAVVALPKAPSWSEDDLVAQLAAHGADKVVLATDEALADGEELRWGTHGGPLSAVCDQLSPSLLLFGLTPAAREVAARAAARMGAAFLARAWIELHEGQLRLGEGDGAESRALDGDLEFAVVATVPAGRYAIAAGDDEAEVEVLATSGKLPDFAELSVVADARPVALIVSDSGAEPWAVELAAALHGVAGAADDVHAAAARLHITVGPPCPAAERRVRLGDVAPTGDRGRDGDATVDYVVPGDAATLARDCTRLLRLAPEGG
jgi:hypothetical protein